MGDEKKRKMIRDIAELFYRRDKAIKDKDTFAFDFTQLDNIGHPPPDFYFSYDDFETKILAVEDLGIFHDHVKIAFAQEFYRTKAQEDKGEPRAVRYIVYYIAYTVRGWMIYRVIPV